MRFCAKILRGFAAAILVAAAAHAASTQSTTPEPPKPFQFALQNGLQVVVLPDHSKPVITQLICYKVGAADDPPGASGTAALLQHLMFSGTRAMPGSAFVDALDRYGGTSGAYTTYDGTVFYEQIGKDRLRLVMHLEADRMAGLDLTDKSAADEVAAALAARHARALDAALSETDEQARAALYLSHPYGRPLGGWSDELRNIDRQDVEDFYRAHYAPNNAILIIAGDVTADDVRAVAEAEYGPLQARERSERAEYAMPPRLGETRLSVVRKDAKTPALLRLYRVPSYAEAAPGQAEALDVFAKLFGGDAGSALYRRLVVQQKIAAGISVSYSGYVRDSGELRILASPASGVSFDTLERGLDAVLAQYQHRAPGKFELARAKAQFASAVRKANQLALAESYARALAIGLTVYDVEQWPARIEAVTAEDVRKAAASLAAKDSVTATLAPVGQ